MVALSVAAAGHAPAGRGASGARRLWSPPPCALQRCSPSRGYASLPGAEAARWDGEEEVTPAEARRLMRLANVDALKQQLGDGEVIPYADLLRVCQEAGTARTRAEAAALAGALDEAGVVLLFRDRVYLQPDKVSSHRIAALSYPSPPSSSPPRFAGFPPSRLGLPVLLAAGDPFLFVRCLNSRMTHHPIPCVPPVLVCLKS